MHGLRMRLGDNIIFEYQIDGWRFVTCCILVPTAPRNMQSSRESGSASGPERFNYHERLWMHAVHARGILHGLSCALVTETRGMTRRSTPACNVVNGTVKMCHATSTSEGLDFFSLCMIAQPSISPATAISISFMTSPLTETIHKSPRRADNQFNPTSLFYTGLQNGPNPVTSGW